MQVQVQVQVQVKGKVLREVILKKKLLTFGHCLKVALTPPPDLGKTSN